MSADEKRDMIARFTAALPVLRKSIHMTQDQLAARSGVSRITVSAVERGRQEMSWGTFVSLLSVFSADSRSLPLLESFGVELSRLGGALPCGTGGEPYGQLYGSAPFSADILSKVSIGLWDIEFDMGQSPRMYVDDTMMRLVDLLGGTIAIESRVNEGTRVCIHLDMEAPEYEPAAEEQSAGEADLSLLKGRRVLLVEDNEMNREIACDILEEYELVIETAENGEEAVALCREAGESTAEERFELILMDIQMPVLDGYEATKAIRAMYPDAKLPIVALSANAFEEDRRKSMDAGMNGHIAKPIDVAELLRVLSELIK